MGRFHEGVVPRPLLGLLVALFLVNAALSVVGNLRLYRSSGQAGFLSAGSGSVARVGQVRHDSPAAALRTGEEILALDGRGVRGADDVWAFFVGRPPGPYRITVVREGRPLDLALMTEPYGWGWSAITTLSKVAVQLLFALSGLVLFLLRPEGKAGLLLSLVFILFVPGDLRNIVPAALPPLERAVTLLSDFLSFLFWPVLLHFLLIFPEPSPVVRRRPWLERAIYWPTLAVMLVAAPVSWLFFTDPDRAWAIARGEKWFSGLAGGLWLGSTLFGLLALVTSYRQASLPSRRRLRVAVVGTVAGFLPLLALISAGSFFDLSRVPLWLLRGLGLLATLALALVPLSFGYAILRHQVIPLRAMLRRGLRYLLVSRGVVLLEALAVVGLVAFVLTGRRGTLVDALGPRADIVIALAVGGLGFVALHRVNRRLRTAIDRRFFREAYDARQLLTGLSEAVREVPNADALVDLVAGRVNAALRPESVRLFLRDEDGERFPLAHPRPSEGGEPAPPRLVDRLAGVDQAVTLEGDEPDLAGMARSAGTSAGPILCLAMRGKRELMGILALGPRLSEVPYSREDRQLLYSVASQAGLSLENSVLIRRVAEQERVAHELEIAAQVQRRLFPDRAPRCRTLDLAGLCVPAGDVGGDYYDFLELGEGRVGFAVADVAGKGLPAALLMSMVQASLRSQAGAGRPIVGLCASMNELLYRSTAPNAYATFFYGVFEEDSRRLAYVNAGHNPPLVVRAPIVPRAKEGPRLAGAVTADLTGAALITTTVAAAAEREAVQRLTATGLVLGALADSPYVEEILVLEPGDVVVAYTDGVSEAFSPRGEEFGEERLAAVVAEGRDLSAAGLVEHVARAVESWRGQAPAHDDFTLVVARIL